MAAVTSAASINVTTNATSYSFASFTPVADDLLVVFVDITGTTDIATVTSTGNTAAWTKILAVARTANNGFVWLFIQNALCTATATVVTVNVTADAGTGCTAECFRVSGMTKVGSTNAAKQTGSQSNAAAATTPAPAFPAAALTQNPTLGMVANATSPAGLTPPTNWTESIDVGHTTPTAGGETVFRNSGFTGTTITWGSTSASAFSDIIVELDTSTGTNATATPSTVAAIGAVPAPTLAATAITSPAMVAGVAAVPAPTLLAAAIASPAVVAAIGSVPAPTVTGTAVTSPSTVVVVGNVPVVTVVATSPSSWMEICLSLFRRQRRGGKR